MKINLFLSYLWRIESFTNFAKRRINAKFSKRWKDFSFVLSTIGIGVHLFLSKNKTPEEIQEKFIFRYWQRSCLCIRAFSRKIDPRRLPSPKRVKKKKLTFIYLENGFFSLFFSSSTDFNHRATCAKPIDSFAFSSFRSSVQLTRKRSRSSKKKCLFVHLLIFNEKKGKLFTERKINRSKNVCKRHDESKHCR